jgi:hypothetical protein
MQGDICPGNLDPLGKLFIVLFALSGLGFFCGPLLEVASSWTKHVPGGLATLASLTLGIGVAVFSNIEGVSHSEAFYASVITGTIPRNRSELAWIVAELLHSLTFCSFWDQRNYYWVSALLETALGSSNGESLSKSLTSSRLLPLSEDMAT